MRLLTGLKPGYLRGSIDLNMPRIEPLSGCNIMSALQHIEASCVFHQCETIPFPFPGYSSAGVALRAYAEYIGLPPMKSLHMLSIYVVPPTRSTHMLSICRNILDTLG